MRRLVQLMLVLSLFSLSACGGVEKSSPTAAAGPNPVVVIDTSMGPIKAELYQDKAPITVKNFLQYVDDKFYDGTIWHRVIPNFMIQGGGFTPEMREKQTRGMIKNESYNGLANQRGTLAMARTPDPDSASSQFFINLKYNHALDKANSRDRVSYAVFGKVLDDDSMDVVNKIAAVDTADRGGHEAVPLEPVLIKSIRRVESK